MAKKIMQDMQSKGVKITRIVRGDISDKLKVLKQKKLAEVESDLTANNDLITKVDNHIFERDRSDKIFNSPTTKKSGLRPRKSYILFLVLSIMVGGVYFISNQLGNAKIVIKEKKESFKLSMQELQALNSNGAPIRFEIMIISDTNPKELTLTDSDNVSIKARGEITLYNENSTKPQNLAIRTLISDSKGKTYQTDKAVSIPGYTTVKSKIVPGKVSVGITSFLPGEAYNGSPSDFSINLFKGTAKGKKIYGKLKSPLVGGAIGTVYKLSPQDLGALNAYALSTFRSLLLKKMTAEAPKGYILYPTAITFSHKVDENILSKTPNAKVNIDATISSVIINEKDLTSSLLKTFKKDILLFELNEIQIPNISGLSFNFSNQNQSIAKDLKSIAFTLTGDITAIWHPDMNSLKNKILGTSKASLLQIFKDDPGISSASVKIFPPWSKYLPSDLSRIHITTQ
ncbi:MAG: hypothetical protein AAB477_03080 [Patescibacteria group bacterium]